MMSYVWSFDDVGLLWCNTFGDVRDDELRIYLKRGFVFILCSHFVT